MQWCDEMKIWCGNENVCAIECFQTKRFDGNSRFKNYYVVGFS